MRLAVSAAVIAALSVAVVRPAGAVRIACEQALFGAGACLAEATTVTLAQCAERVAVERS